MDKKIRMLILGFFGVLFTYAGMYLLSDNFIVGCATTFYGTMISFKNFIGMVGVAFGNYIFFEMGRIKW